MSMIRRVEKFEYQGKVFDTVPQATDYAEGLVYAALKPDMLAGGFTITECVKVSNLLLANRKVLAELLGYETDFEVEDDQ